MASRPLFALALVLLAPAAAVAQPTDASASISSPALRPLPSLPRKGDLLTLKLPAALLRQDGRTRLLSYPIYVVDIQGTPDGRLSVGGTTDWIAEGFPSLLQLKFVKSQRKDGVSIIELEPASRTSVVKLQFATNTDPLRALPAVAFSSADSVESDATIAQAYRVLGSKYFTGALAGLDDGQKTALLSFAHLTANGTTLGSEVYKGQQYLVVDLGSDTSVYNDLKFTQASLVAQVMNSKLLTILKAFAKPVEHATVVQGLKLQFKIPHRDFLREEVAKTSVLQVYAPSTAIKQFADAEITSQQLVDACVVIADDNRIQVPLAGQ